MQEVVRQEHVADDGRQGRVPGWMAGVGVGAFLLAAGLFIYWFLGGSFGGTTELIPDPARVEQAGGHGRHWRQPANPDGVKALSNHRGYYVWAAGAIMDVEQPAPGKKKREVKYRFRYDSHTLLTPEQWHLAVGLRRVGQDAQMARTLDVTKDQLDRLRRFDYVPMELSTADRTKLIAAWDQYEKERDKAAEEKTLVALLKTVGAKALPATKVNATKRVAEISQLLSPEQVRELTKLGAGQKVTPIAHAAAAAGATTRPV